MRTLLMISAAALLAGSMAAYGADTQRSDESSGIVAAPAYTPGARAEVPTGLAPAPAILYKAPVDVQDPPLSR